MPRNDPVASRVVRHVLTRAIGDAVYRRTLLEKPNEVMRFELARFGGPVPKVNFDAVEETETRWVLRVPVSKSERRAQETLQPVFEFVDSASKDDLDRFVHAPRKTLEELLGIELDEGIDVVVRIEAEGHRVLVVPQDEFPAISSESNPALEAKKKKKLCPKGVTIDLCPKDVTIVDVCPADCTFTESCDCTISCTVTGDFPTIPDMALSADDVRQDSVRKLSDLLDD